ncbi:uncharacterized protein DUF4148 [Paraburkholderia sp. BL23I1N1]|uniref:DUF4148 domain-containing protein n=1 Tax=Paraburkholderia sp. BL23I1N1 TaxID=1938802 RepID=UPI000E762B41|nr:DUF4148 domain-containing protein [Paraburkholderia sp. BL23I1N1]RKE37205.1 uncharacterized protein DUF4148 [Paraburkholderia sp. BL23I1N1]
MNRRNTVSSTLAISIILGLICPTIAFAQDGSSGPTISANSATKQSQNAQRKAERKANRAQKNAELGQLEKHGYNPAKDQTTYPQDLHNAQKKLNSEKQGAKPTSEP